MKRVTSFVFSFFAPVLVLAASGHTPAIGAERIASPPAIAVQSAIMLERETGRLLFERAPDRRLPPASLTKIMGALVAIEAAPLHAVVTVGRESIAERPPRLRLRPGDQLLLRDLIAAMLITSANDACLAVAHHVAGGEAAFVALLNRKSAALGLTNTHFDNACGFDGPAHYSTARDLARLTETALANDLFAILVRTVETEIATVDGRKKFALANTNRLLWRAGVTGVKTGFTQKAGRCLAATAFRDGRSLLLIGLGFEDRWQDAEQLLGYGLAQLHADQR